MDSIREVMNKIIEKCDVCLAGNVISKELLLKTFSDFILSTIENQKHNVGIVLHTGSICFDAILLAYVAITNILYNKTDATDVILSLRPGDLVLCYNGSKGKTKPSKWEFIGFIDSLDSKQPQAEQGKYIVLQGDKNNYNYLPESSWSKITPYFGKSKSMDARGLRRENGKRYQFFKSVLEMQDSDIPRTIDTSTVIVMSHEEANKLINEMSFRFEGIEMKLTELVSVSYFSERDQEYPCGANPSKSEPVIKLTGKVSVARKLLLDRGGNNNIGLIVLGDESYRRGESELPELIERKSLQYVYLCLHIDSEASAKLVANYEDAELFACTKDFLLSNSLPSAVKNPFTKQLEDQVNAIIDKAIDTIEIPCFIDWEHYKSFKRSILCIKAADYVSDEKNSFIIQSFSLMNLFLTSIFPIKLLEDYIDFGIIENVEKPERRLQIIRENAKTLPDYLKEAASNVVQILEEVYLKLYDNCVKKDAFLQIISENPQKKIAVVVPKAYYVALVDKVMNDNCSEYMGVIDVETCNRFDNTKLYDLIVVVGNISGSRFDALRCRSAQTIKVLLYDAEKYQYKKRECYAKAAEHILNQRSTMLTDDEYVGDPIGLDESEIAEVDEIDTEITDFISSTVVKAVRNSVHCAGDKNMADIVAVAKFESDEVAFFTKNFKAYVLDETEHSVKEVSVPDLSEGDTIVFTRSTSKTRDIVEDILHDMIRSQLVPKEVEKAYYKSREWKTTLIDYMKCTGSSVKTIADEMIGNGVSVQEITIRGWLDEASHTVRPQKIESIQQIALIAGNEELFDDAEACFAAGGTIYKIRRKILKAIGQAILGEVTGRTDDSNLITAAISNRIKEAAVTLQIESITFLNDEVPMNTINRPISID